MTEIHAFDPDGTPSPGAESGVSAIMATTLDPQVAACVDDESTQTRANLEATLVPQAKTIRGGVQPKPLRYPMLAIERMWPNADESVRVVWASTDGATVYAFDQEGQFLKSVNGGVTWTPRGQIPAQTSGLIRGFGRSGTFLRLSDGVTMLSFRLHESAGIAFRIARSTDEGATWTDVDVTDLMSSGLSASNGGGPMGPTAWCQDPVTGHVYYGEYDASDTKTEVNLYRSTDKGLTWAKFHTFPGPATTHPDRVRHIHAVEWDPVSKRIVVMVGDPEPAAGIYRVNAAGTALEPWLLNRQVTNLEVVPGHSYNQSARAIGFMPFPDYVVYAADSALRGVLRVPRSALTNDGTTNVAVERVYQLNSTAWFAQRAATDGSRWVVSASQEGPNTRIDAATHLYAVEDQGATVYELGALPVTSSGFVSLAPVGGAHGGDTFYLQTHNSLRWAMWRCTLTKSSGVQIPWPSRDGHPDAWAWETFNVPVTTLAAGEAVKVAVVQVPLGARLLRVYDMGVKAISGAGSSLRFRIKTVGGTTFQDTSVRSERLAAGLGPSAHAWKTLLTSPGSEAHIEIENIDGSLPATGLGFITLGWGASY